MLQSEFESLVKMKVSVEEYSHIEQVYLASDLHKDEFCRLWCQMNKSRIAEYKSKMKEKERHGRLIDRLWSILGKYTYRSWEWKYGHFAPYTLCKKDIEAVNSAGIGVYRGHDPKNMSDLLSDVNYFVRHANH